MALRGPRSGRVAGSPAPHKGWLRPLGWLRSAGQFLFTPDFSSLTRRIVSLNLAGLIALVVGILYLSQFRAGLIDARAQSLLVQGEIIAGAIAASARSRPTPLHRSGPAARPAARRELRRAGRIFRTGIPDQSGAGGAGAAPADLADQDARPHLRSRRRLILDSRSLYVRGDVMRFDLPPPKTAAEFVERTRIAIRNWFSRGDLQHYRELGPANGKGYPEVAQALDGAKSGHGARQRSRRGHRLGRGAGAALPRRARRAAALDPGRRHQPDGRRPKVEVLAGINLPMLVKLAKVREERSLPDAIAMAQEAGRKYVTIASRVLAGK